METIVRRKELVEALRLAVAVIPKARYGGPGLQWVKLEPRGQWSGQLTVNATDLAVTIHRTIEAGAITAGLAVVVEGKPFLKLVKELTGDVLVLESDGHKLHIRSTGAAMSLPLQEAKEYPPLPAFGWTGDPKSMFQIDAGQFQRMIKQTTFATARESTQYAINGVMVEAAGRTAKLLSTDGRRMSMSAGRMDRDVSAKQFPDTIIPLSALALLARVKLTADSLIDVGVWSIDGSKNPTLGLRAENLVIMASVVDGNFPKYADVIPRSTNKSASLPVADLTAAIKAVAAACDFENKGCRFTFAPGVLTLTVESGGVPVATAAVPIQYDGSASEIGFNPCFVLDVLAACGADSIDFAWSDPNVPGLFTVDSNFTHVLMPVQLAVRASVLAA